MNHEHLHLFDEEVLEEGNNPLTVVLLFENNDSIIGFCVSSDYDRNKFLYTIELNDWFDFMNIIITDAVVATKLLANEKNYDYEYIEMKRGKHRVLKP